MQAIYFTFLIKGGILTGLMAETQVLCVSHSGKLMVLFLSTN